MFNLKTQLQSLTDNRDICETITKYLANINPFRLSSVAVWGNIGQGYFCQAHENGEFYGNTFKIDIENETIQPI